MTEGAAATWLLKTGIYTGKPDGGLKALRAVSICVGLPYTFLICFMCLSLWRACQYEYKDRIWNSARYFQSEITDIGITLYTAKEGTSCFNFGIGKLDIPKLLKTVLYIVCPTPALWSGTVGLATKKKLKSTVGAKALAVAGTVCFYTWLILAVVDYAPVSKDPVEMGAVMGNATDAGGSTLYYVSTRYGYFRGWTNSEFEEGAIVTKSNEVNKKAGEVGIRRLEEANTTEMKAQITNLTSAVLKMEGQIANLTNLTGELHSMVVPAPPTPSLSTPAPPPPPPAVGVGDRIGRNIRIEAIGWFFFFCFITIVAFIRNETRVFHKIPGTLFEDFLSASFVYPTVLYQVQYQVSLPEDPEPSKGVVAAKDEPAAPIAPDEAATAPKTVGKEINVSGNENTEEV